MRRILKRVLSAFLVPATRWYLRKERTHIHKGIEVKVFPGVFHPGFFSSTHFLIKYLEQTDLTGTRLLELGSGTGLISVWACTRGASVVASDLSSRAVANTSHNVEMNAALVQVVHSDLFDKIKKQSFDWIVINPPYYARPIKNEESLAWHCGENLEYFEKLFGAIRDYLHAGTQVLMILTKEGCDRASIFRIAERHGFYFELLKERKAMLDGKDYLFRIRRSVSPPPAAQV